MRRTLGGILAIAVLLSTAPAAAAVGGSPALSDFNGHWAKDYIEQGAGAGYASEFPDGTFQPDRPVTRAEFFRMLTGAMAQPLFPNGYSGLTHEESHWAFARGYAQSAVRAGLLFPPDYGPELGADTEMKRREIVLATVRAIGKGALVNTNDPTLPTPDANAYPAWLKGWAAVALADGIITGYQDGSLGLERTATRAEAVTVIQRVLAQVTARAEPADAPTNDTARRYPAAGEPEWRLVDRWAEPPDVTDGTHSYVLPKGARGVTLMAAPGQSAYVRYTADGTTQHVMYDVILRLKAGQMTEVFRQPFTGKFRYLVAVDGAGRGYFAEGNDLKVIGAGGAATALTTLPARAGTGYFGPDGSLWMVSPDSSQELFRIRPDGTLDSYETGFGRAQGVVQIEPMPDGSVWLLATDTEGRLEAVRQNDGQTVQRLTLTTRYMAGPDPMAPLVLGRSGDGLYVARRNKTGEATWKESGFFRFDLTTGAFRPVVLPPAVHAPAQLLPAPDGGTLARDKAGKFWRIQP